MKTILVIAEQFSKTINTPSFEVISEAVRIKKASSAKVVVQVMGDVDANSLDELKKFNIDEIVIDKSEVFSNYLSETYSKGVCALLSTIETPVLILLPATSQGKDLAGRLSGKLDCGLVADCISIDIQNPAELIYERPIYAGKIVSTVKLETADIQIATLRPKTFEKEYSEGSPSVTDSDLGVTTDDAITTCAEIIKTTSSRPELTEADIIVSGGRGIKSAENFKMLEELADLLGASVGASRAAVDSDYRAQSDQVGQTGKTVSPKLYIACGISGAIQHLVGMSSSKYIVAINKDPEAPIFKKADFGIVGDIFDVVPKLIDEIKKVKTD